MGLAVSRAIIEAHGGVCGGAEQTRGAIFQFTLPLGGIGYPRMTEQKTVVTS